jgi:hypothetical protein
VTEPTIDEHTPRAAEEPQPTGGVVAVVGAPGSGGDLVARLLGVAGVDLVGGPSTTDRRHSDSPVVGVADRVLSVLGGTGVAPPELRSGWEQLPEVLALVPAATEVFEREFAAAASEATTQPGAAWFESASLVLPFWRSHLGVPRAAVVTWRRPEATVEALATEAVSAVHALALWEVYAVRAAADTAGLPVIGIDVDDLLAEPETGVGALLKLVADLGVPVPPDAAERMAELVAGARPGGTAPLGRVEGADEVLARHAATLHALSGGHDCWQPPAELVVGPWSEAVLAGLRAAHRSATEAARAWIATDEAQVAAEEAERLCRELDGPDQVADLDLRREVWRLRDEIIGLEAERATLYSKLVSTDAARVTAEHRALAMNEARVQRDEMLFSARWRIGGFFVAPLRPFRRWLTGR